MANHKPLGVGVDVDVDTCEDSPLINKDVRNGVPEPLPIASAVEFPEAIKGKRILIATESLGPINGVSRTTGMLIEYLRSNDVEVAVVAPEISASKMKTSNSAHANLRLFGWPLPYNPDLTIVYPFRLDRVFRRTFRPDLIYLASPASVGFQVLLQVRQLHNSPPVICNFQTDLSSYGQIIFPARLGMDVYATWLLGVVQRYLFNSPRVHTVFYPCGDIQRYLQASGVVANKLAHLGRGVNTETFDPSRRDEAYRKELAPHGEVILICVTRLAPEKGFEFLAQAALKLVEEKVPFTLLIVGGNRNPAVQDKVKSYFDPVRERVVFTGFLTGDSLARAYASADLFLHCSITETFGLVVLEAMASGVPVIARDQGGPSEIVRHDKTGYLSPPTDLSQFVHYVRRLSLDANLRDQFALAARQVALETTWEKINNRAAWYIAAALQKQESEIRARAKARAGQIWFIRILSAFSNHIATPLVMKLRLWFAVAVVTLFWVIACTPLIVHGTFVYQAD